MPGRKGNAAPCQCSRCRWRWLTVRRCSRRALRVSFFAASDSLSPLALLSVAPDVGFVGCAGWASVGGTAKSPNTIRNAAMNLMEAFLCWRLCNTMTVAQIPPMESFVKLNKIVAAAFVSVFAAAAMAQGPKPTDAPPKGMAAGKEVADKDDGDKDSKKGVEGKDGDKDGDKDGKKDGKKEHRKHHDDKKKAD